MPRHYTKQDVKNLVAQINSEGSAHMKELIAESFLEGDTDNSGTLSCNEVINAFKKCQINFANYQLRELLQKYDKNKDGQLNINEWADMVFAEEAIRQANMKASDIRNIGKEGVVEVSDLGRKFIPHGLVPKYGNYFNRLFQKNNDQDILKLKKIIDPESETDLFEKLGDGIILCQMINYCQKNTIPKKAINWKIPKNNKAIFLERENLDLAINSASAIGLKTINYSSTNFNSRNYNKTLVLGLVWQMVAMHSQRGLNLTSNPFLRKLFPEGTSQAEILRLAPEELLLVWVNYHLDKNPSWDGKKVTNFKSDFTNGKAFIALMNQIQPEENHPKFNHNLMKTGSDSERQTLVENMAKQLHLGDFITAQDIADEEQKITMLFLAELFNLYPGLEDGEEFIDPDDDECKMYKNWINSLGLEGVKKMLYFFPPLVSGNVFLRLVDLMNPGSVNWKKVTEGISINK